jgi:serine/threonine protein kinase
MDGMQPAGQPMLGGRYQVLGTIDCGTLAEMRLGYDTVLRRHVAIKLAADVLGETARGRLDVSVFKREAEMAASLQHPHLLPVYDYGIDGDQHCLVTRVFHETLRDLSDVARIVDALARPRRVADAV